MNFLDELKTCPICRQQVRYGSMIWKDGICMCPNCYNKYTENLRYSYKKGYEDAKNFYEN